MLTQLATIKSRLAIPPETTTNDALLLSAIKAVSARFDKETNRTLARTADFTQEFDGATTEVVAACYPIESVTKFETKTNETDGWIEQPDTQFLIRRACIISLSVPLCTLHSALCRITYAGGYVLPGTTPAPGQTPLPDDLEQAAVEQVAFWFQSRDMLGLDTTWPHLGTYEKFTQSDLLLQVRAVLKHYTRWLL
jgi:hypothetical protein